MVGWHSLNFTLIMLFEVCVGGLVFGEMEIRSASCVGWVGVKEHGN